MLIEIRVAPPQLRRWIGVLAERLQRDLHADVRLTLTSSTSERLPAVELLLQLERMITPWRAPPWNAPWLSSLLPLPDHTEPDAIIDLTGNAQAQGTARVLRPRYNGMADERALLADLIDERMPLIEIEDAGTGAICLSGVPSDEAALGLNGAFDAAMARLITMLVAVLRNPKRQEQAPPHHHSPRNDASTLTYVLRRITIGAARHLYRMSCYTPHWRIGWRIHDGPGVWDTGTLDGTPWQVLADPVHRFYADPFPVSWQGRTMIFMEDLDHRIGKGIISAVEFDENGPIREVFPVLEEPWHLSYPFLIEHKGELWMIPESSASHEVTLYRCERFPDKWIKEATLLHCIEASDVTITSHGGKLWMFAATRDGFGAYSDTLSLFFAQELLGPWMPHPLNPVLIDALGSRPGGQMLLRGDRLWRPAQDCGNGYGSALALAEVTRLDEEGFEQRIHHVIHPGPRWPGRKLHTLNRCGRLECIDGVTYNPKLGFLSKLTQPYFMPRE